MTKGGKVFQVTGAVFTQAVVAQADLDRSSHTLAALVQTAAYNEPNNSMVPPDFQAELRKAINEVFDALAILRHFMDNAAVGDTPLTYTPSPVPYPPDVQP